MLIYICCCWSDFNYATMAFRKCDRTSLGCIASSKDLVSLSDANVLTRTEERWSFRFWHYLGHSRIRMRPPSIHIPGALNAKRYFRYRLCRSVSPAIHRYDERDRIYFQFGHGQSNDNVDRHPGCGLTVTHVPTMRLRLVSMHPEVKIRLIDVHTWSSQRYYQDAMVKCIKN